ncbi:MAG: hypothetical protein EP297_06000 [Gammaproteobacteria bacterium]|nr:MAG: hypothetical protein EP297_06000 [Gammaproteobacteria bacterium]
MSSKEVLLGDLNFVNRTSGSVDQRGFENTPFILDSEARLHIGPADHLARDQHGAILVIYEFLRQTKSTPHRLSTLLRNRANLLEAYVAFDQSRRNMDEKGPKIIIYGTYDGVPIETVIDDDLPAGPCGKSVNEIKWEIYRRCLRLDPQFASRDLTEDQRKQESRFLPVASSI